MQEPVEIENGCLTCFQQPRTDFLKVQHEDSSEIEDVLRHHFWYTEVDFEGAVICQPCWEQVSSFHQFYVSAEELYRKRLGSLIGESELVADQGDNGSEQSENLLRNESEDVVISIDDTDESNDVIYNEEETEATDEDQPIYLAKNWSQKEEKRAVDEEYIKQHVRYLCPQCGHESQTFADHKAHTDAHGIPVCYVECCGTKHYNRTRLLDHVKTIINPEAFRCDICQKNYAYNFTLQRHIGEAHTTEEERTFKCDQCPKSFALRYQYKAHMRDHEDLAKICCGRSFKNSRTYTDHYRRHHDLNRKKISKSKAKFKCIVCRKRFLSKALLGKHQMMHEKCKQRLSLSHT